MHAYAYGKEAMLARRSRMRPNFDDAPHSKKEPAAMRGRLLQSANFRNYGLGND